MTSEVYFENIKEQVLDALKKAKVSIYCAVAWITDAEFIDALKGKSKSGVKVQLVVMDDSFNRDNISVLVSSEEDFQVFFKDSHHKYCIIDEEILLSGSFNWTYKASARTNGENLMISTDKNLLFKFKRNFTDLISESSIDNNKQVDYLINKLKEYYPSHDINHELTNWWYAQKYDMKYFVIEEFIEQNFGYNIYEFESDIDKIQTEYYPFIYSEEGIDRIERLALHELLCFLKNINRIVTSITFREENYEVLLYLKKLQYIPQIVFKTFNDFEHFISNIDAKIQYLIISDVVDTNSAKFEFYEEVEMLDVTFDRYSKNIISSLPKTLKSITLRGKNMWEDDYFEPEWLCHLIKLERVNLNYLKPWMNKVFSASIEYNINGCEIVNCPTGYLTETTKRDYLKSIDGVNFSNTYKLQY